MHRPPRIESAFSLVELSIVLVILGLLTGGILAGKSLIRASELRSVTSEASRYITAMHSFRDKYFYLPGDMNNATRFWGIDPSGCPTNAARTKKTATCDGNGDGRVGDGGVGTGSEGLRFWQQLANAGLIEGSYTGTGTDGSNYTVVASENTPASRANAVWAVRNLGDYLGSTEIFRMDYGNINMEVAQQTSGYPNDGFLTPEEAWNIDSKVDDGKPGLGKWIARARSTCGLATSTSDLQKDYRLDSNAIVCAFIIRGLS